ncbi:MAG: hypothetical protein FH758_07185 [Firmicutes bacterium]|nr:hypothetical protein [Bacillota bacterium]
MLLLNNSNITIQILVLLCIILTVATLIWCWQTNRLNIYIVGRELGRLGAKLQTVGLPEVNSKHFTVKYYTGDKEQALMVLRAAEEFIKPVSNHLEYKPHRKEIIVVYPTREKLNAYFGWPADESAMGVYWAGTIRVLAPREWLETANSNEAWDKFVNTGPMAHEIAHLIVDYRTRGNYNRWFTEGVAQYIELKLTGFRFREESGNLRNKRYTLTQLNEKYDSLPNQALAYRQSLAAVYYIINQYGEESLASIINTLRKGLSLDEALQKECGVNLDQFEDQLNNWLDYNWEIFS